MVQFSSVAQLCPTLGDPMNCSTPGLPVHHQPPEFTELMSIESVMPSSHLILCCPLLLLPQSLPASGSFPVSQLFAWGGQSTGVSASASFLPKKSQGWSPLEWTGWISLQSKGPARVFSNTTSYSNTWELNWKPKIPKKNRQHFQQKLAHAGWVLWEPLWHVAMGTYVSTWDRAEDPPPLGHTHVR